MRWGSIIKFCRRTICRVLAVILLIGLAVFFYLSIQGVPRWFVDRWLSELRSVGYFVTVERIRLDLIEGIVAEQFRCFETEVYPPLAAPKATRNQPLPMLEAERVTLFINPFDWFHHRAGLRRLYVHNGLVRLSTGDRPNANDAEALLLRNVDAALRFDHDAWRLRDFSADLLGLKIRCRGILLIQSSAVKPAPAKAVPAVVAGTHETDVPMTRKLNELTRSQSARISELIRQMRAMTFSVPPHADITFTINPEDASANEAMIRLGGWTTRVGSVTFDQWRLLTELKGARVILSEALLRQGSQHLTLSGSYNFTNRVVSACFRGHVILKDWMSLAPSSWRDALISAGCSMNGPIQCEVQMDPAPVEQVLQQFHGWISLTQATLQGVWIEKGFAAFTKDGETVQVDPIHLVLGQGRQKGPLQGHFIYNLATREYEGHADTQFDPKALLSILNSNQADIVNSLVFNGKPPIVDLDFTGRGDHEDCLRVTGHVQGSNFTYNTVPIVSLDSAIGYTNGILSFDAMRLIRPEGQITGRWADHLDGNIADLDLVSTADPKAIARLIGPEAAAFLDGFHFQGPMRIAARGRVDYGSNLYTDVSAVIDGRHWGYSLFRADQCSLNMTVQQLRFELTNIRGEAYEGTFSGKTLFYPVGADTHSQASQAEASPGQVRYDLSARADDVNFNTLLQSLGYQGKEEYEGLLYSECAMAGFIGAGRGDTVAGGGWIRIQDGQLIQLRLFGGFSHWTAHLNPNLGFINLTDFSANVRLKNRQIQTRDAALAGKMLTIRGEGQYAFDGGLDFIVWAQAPEHKTLFPELTKIRTPISKLLAFRLTGTVSDPKWWPLNLTKEQLVNLPKDLLITLPKDLLIGLPKDLLINLPKEVLTTLPKELLITLPKEVLVTLPKEILIDLPKELLIDLPKDIWKTLNHVPASKTK